MDKLRLITKKIIYDPVIARILYDVCVCFVSILGISVSFLIFEKSRISHYTIILYPAIIIAINMMIGMYSRFKMSSTIIKALLLSSSVIIGGSITNFVSFQTHQILLATIFSIPLLILPRAFVNLHVRYKNNDLQTVVLDNAPILVVGGGGYIGTHVVEQLLKQNYKVRVFDKFIYSKNVFTGMRNSKNLEIIEGDISDIYQLTIAVKNVQAVIHLAGIVGDPAAALDEKLTRHVNSFSTYLLKEAVKAFQIPRFIFASSCSVYGASDTVVNENSSLSPVSLYAQTKIDSENELLTDTFDTFHPTILRFATVFGHSRKPRFDLVGNLFVAQAYTNGEITVHNGNQWRPFIHVSDVARAIILVLQAPIDKVDRQIFNVGDNRLNITIGNLAKKVKTTIKSEKDVRITESLTTNDQRNYKVSFKKINTVLNFSASISLSKGLKEIFDNFKKNAYSKPYSHPYYSNVEMTKLLKKEFRSKKYSKTHITVITD